jgi:hypothetical protein
MQMAIKTPNHIEVLIHYYLSSTDHPRLSSPAVKEIVREFVEDDIFEDISDFTLEKINSPSFKLTEKGIAWLLMLLDTPYPIPKTIWLDQKGKPINTKREISQASNVTRFPETEAQYKQI